MDWLSVRQRQQQLKQQEFGPALPWGGLPRTLQLQEYKKKQERIMKRKSLISAKIKRTPKRPRTTLAFNSGRQSKRGNLFRETHALDLASSTLNFSTTGNFALLNPVVVGSELYQRDGRMISMKSIHIRGFIGNISTSTQDFGRIILFYDAQCNGGTPALSTLLQDCNGGAATSATSEINLNNRQRFTILRDYNVQFGAVTNTGGVLTNYTVADPIKNTFDIDWFINLKQLTTAYNTTNAGNVGDITGGALFLLCVNNSTSNTWQLTYGTRLRFYD